MNSLVTVSSNALIYKGPPLTEQTDAIFFASAGHENKGDKKQDGSQDELDVGPVHTGQQRT